MWLSVSLSRGTDGRHVVMAFTDQTHSLFLLLLCVMMNNYGVIIVCYALSK